jgi:hypothetical protein
MVRIIMRSNISSITLIKLIVMADMVDREVVRVTRGLTALLGLCRRRVAAAVLE